MAPPSLKRDATEEHTQLKTCQYCFEEIDERAKRCPHCASAQHWLYSPVGGLVVWQMPFLAIILGFGLFGYITFKSIFGKGEDFAQYADKIEVTQTHMFIGEDWEGKREAVVVGVIRNNSEVPWTWLNIEVQFFNAEGRMIDTEIADSGMFSAVLPQEERAFKAKTTVSQPEEEYVSFKVFVRDAGDARAPLGF